MTQDDKVPDYTCIILSATLLKMNIALNELGKRIDPTPQGRGNCQVCKEVVIAHCGDIYTWHWQHKIDRNCDPWKEHETEWHRGWKNKFPKQWQEFLIENDEGERHLADVRTDNGVVLEFQNSSISTSTIRVREEFYGNMVWVVNAQGFKDNFRIWSVVKQKLRSLDNRLACESTNLEKEFDGRVDKIKEDISEKEREIKTLRLKIEDEQRELEIINKYGEDVESVFEKVIHSWTKSALLDFRIYRIITDFLDESHHQKFRSNQDDRELLNARLESLNKSKNKIDSLLNIEIEGEQMKLIDFNQINKENYHQARFINRESRATFFPVIKKIKNDWEFQNFFYERDKYDIAIDLSDTNNKVLMQLELTKKEMRDNENYIPSVKNELTECLMEAIRTRKSEMKKRIENWIDESSELVKKVSGHKVLEDQVNRQKVSEVSKAKKESKKEIDKKRFEFMTEDKGLYSYNWKHERTTWRRANNPVYLDFGNYLFSVVDAHLMEKIKPEDFLKRFR